MLRLLSVCGLTKSQCQSLQQIASFQTLARFVILQGYLTLQDFVTIILEKATSKDAEALHAMQIESFLPLLAKYKDHDTNPACEPLDKTLIRINDPLKGFYKILKDHTLVGGIAIKHMAPGTLFLGPIFIDPNFQNQKIAQEALKLIEDIFPTIDSFELASIVQEKSNVYLYEKMGYIATGENKKINDSADILFFIKIVKRT